MSSSLSFRRGFRVGDKYRFFASCWVIVLAPRKGAAIPVCFEGLLDFDEVDALMPPESRILCHENRAFQMRRDAAVRYPLMYAPRHATFGARLTRAEIHEGGRLQVSRAQLAHIGQREIQKRDVGEPDSSHCCQYPAEAPHANDYR